MSTATAETPRIYVACLASYNAGVLHGAWIDVDGDADDLMEQVQVKVLRTSPYPNVTVEDPDTGEDVPSAEEWAIHDFDGFGGYKVSESEDFETLCKVAEGIEQHGEIFAAYIDYQGIEYADQFEDAYRGEYDSLEDYAEQFAEDCGLLEGMPENLRCYFNFESFGEDMRLNGDVWIIERGRSVHIFDNHV